MILLDTQVVYWTVTGSERLGKRARARMTAARCFVSPISVVEFRIKQLTGKLTLPSDLPAQLRSQGLEDLTYDVSHADGLTEFPQLAGHDPFDRMLLTQARIGGLALLTADSTLLALDQPWIIDATL